VIDLHTHLLPGCDDGARDWDEAEAMLAIARADGIRTIALTPHLRRFDDEDDPLAALRDEFRERFGSLPLEFVDGAEIRVHPELLSDLRTSRPTMNRSSYFFLEFPATHLPPGIQDFLSGIIRSGFIPIITHPERNRTFQRDPGVLFEMVAYGCLAQITASSLTGEFGREPKKTAHLFLSHHLVQVIASDAHDAKDRPPVLSRAVEAARKSCGLDTAAAMVTTFPRTILNNGRIGEWEKPIDPRRRKRSRVSVPEAFRRAAPPRPDR
jgi:protein-tyrosine phosphatase